jgi:hypothetical protein
MRMRIKIYSLISQYVVRYYQLISIKLFKKKILPIYDARDTINSLLTFPLPLLKK